MTYRLCSDSNTNRDQAGEILISRLITLKTEKMEMLISCCGLDCAKCDARIATVNNDDELRKATSQKWSVEYNAPGLTFDMINCTGCRVDGVKFRHCSECEIRNCAIAKGYETCGQCSEMETCAIVSTIHKYVPYAATNLRNLYL